MQDLDDATVEFCGDGDPRPASMGPAEQLEMFPGERKRCAWCAKPIRPLSETGRHRRVESIFGSQSCRQASHRFFKLAPRDRSWPTSRRMSMAFADPPYRGKAKRYYEGHPDYAGEVDHAELIARLIRDFPDGWALSCSAESLPELLRLCPDDPRIRVGVWFRGERPSESLLPLSAWEAVIVFGGRPKLSPVDERRVDALVTDNAELLELGEAGLVYVARPRLTDPKRVVGAKPATFLWWLFELLGLQPGDELVDLFPGSGGVGRAWGYLSSLAAAEHDASRTTTVMA